MDFTNGFYKVENPVDAIVQLNNVSHSISTNALVKADVLDKLPENPFRSILNGMLQSKG